MDKNLPFDDLITITEGSVRIHSDGKTFELSAGDLAWFLAQTALTYEVAEKVTLSYAIYPLPGEASDVL